MNAALTQEQLATLAAIQRQTIIRLERGGQTTPTTMRKLADALHCEPRDLMRAD